jgi:hypothetical protein
VSDLDALYARLKVATGRDVWKDTLTLPEPMRTDTIMAWLDDDWVKLPDRRAEALDVLGLILTIVGDVGAFAGAGTAVAGFAAAAKAL